MPSVLRDGDASRLYLAGQQSNRERGGTRFPHDFPVFPRNYGNTARAVRDISYEHPRESKQPMTNDWPEIVNCHAALVVGCSGPATFRGPSVWQVTVKIPPQRAAESRWSVHPAGKSPCRILACFGPTHFGRCDRRRLASCVSLYRLGRPTLGIGVYWRESVDFTDASKRRLPIRGDFRLNRPQRPCHKARPSHLTRKSARTPETPGPDV